MGSLVRHTNLSSILYLCLAWNARSNDPVCARPLLPEDPNRRSRRLRIPSRNDIHLSKNPQLLGSRSAAANPERGGPTDRTFGEETRSDTDWPAISGPGIVGSL